MGRQKTALNKFDDGEILTTVDFFGQSPANTVPFFRTIFLATTAKCTSLPPNFLKCGIFSFFQVTPQLNSRPLSSRNDFTLEWVQKMTTQPMPDWDEIVEQNAERVFRIAYRILGSVHDAEDVSQNVFAEAFDIHARGPVKDWTGLFVRLATLRAIDVVRKRKTQQRTKPVADHDAVSHVSPDDEAMGAELAHWLRTAVSQLPAQQSAVFSLFTFEEMNRNEVSEVLGISPDAVSTSLHKGRQKILSQLAVLNGGTN